MAAREVATVEAGGREVDITSPGKVFFPSGRDQLDLVRYLAVEGPAMAAMGGGRC